MVVDRAKLSGQSGLGSADEMDWPSFRLSEHQIVSAEMREANSEIISIERFLIGLSGSIFSFIFAFGKELSSTSLFLPVLFALPFAVSVFYFFRVLVLRDEVNEHYAYLLELESRIPAETWNERRSAIAQRRVSRVRRRYVFASIILFNAIGFCFALVEFWVPLAAYPSWFTA